MSHAVPSLPSSACAYEVYDPETLLPGNDSTYIRLMELGWTAADFAGRTVLDIGANTGILSLRAQQLGASAVHAVDVQPPLVEFFSSVVARHGLPIRVEKKAFNDLDPAVDAADVVFLMEVLHWLVDQGGTIPDALAQVASLTRQTLFLETPWDVREPSIAHKGTVGEDLYNAELILRELSRHFEEVRILRFMTYFGSMKDSKRVLIRADRRRAASLPLKLLHNANLLGISMRRGPNEIELVTTLMGPKVIKSLPPYSCLSTLPDADFEALCAYLAGIKSPTITPPERIGPSYRYRGADGVCYMMFPFVGRLRDHFPTRTKPPPVDDPLELVIRLRDDLRGASGDIIAPVRAACPPLSAVDIDALEGESARAVRESAVAPFLRSVAGGIGHYDRGREDALVHHDMQLGNMLIDPAGRLRIVDIDLLRTGTPYTDLLTCTIYNGGSPDGLKRAIAQQIGRGDRPPTGFDISFAVTTVAGWLREISNIGHRLPDYQLRDFLAGLSAVCDLDREIGAAENP